MSTIKLIELYNAGLINVQEVQKELDMFNMGSDTRFLVLSLDRYNHLTIEG